MLEKYLESEKIQLSGTIEYYETYVLESSSGSSLKHRKAHHRGEPSKFRGISHEQICIVTTTDKNAHEIFWQLANPDQPKILYRIPSKITLHNALSSTQTEQSVITLWQNVRIIEQYINRYTALFVCMRRFMEMDLNKLYEKLAWMIRYPFVITTKALQNHNLFSFSIQE